MQVLDRFIGMITWENYEGQNEASLSYNLNKISNFHNKVNEKIVLIKAYIRFFADNTFGERDDDDEEREKNHYDYAMLIIFTHMWKHLICTRKNSVLTISLFLHFH